MQNINIQSTENYILHEDEMSSREEENNIYFYIFITFALSFFLSLSFSLSRFGSFWFPTTFFLENIGVQWLGK